VKFIPHTRRPQPHFGPCCVCVKIGNSLPTVNLKGVTRLRLHVWKCVPPHTIGFLTDAQLLSMSISMLIYVCVCIAIEFFLHAKFN